MFCTKCGSELPEGVKHCYVCGAAVRQLPPLHTGQAFPAGQNTPASPTSPSTLLYGTAGQPGRQQSGPAYQATAQGSPSAASGSAYQTSQTDPLPRPTWPPRPANESPAAPSAPCPAYTTGAGQASPSYPPPPPVSPAYQSGTTYAAYHHSKGADISDTVSTFEWLWSSLVMLVPMLNFILLAVWAFGVGAKPSKRNWARAMLILLVVWVVLALALVELLDQMPV